MLHVYDSAGKYVASVNKQSRGSEFYNAAEPWLLLYHSGRIERFATLAEARDEARKTWGAKTRFEKHDPMRKSNPARKPAAKKPAAKRAYVNRPSQVTKKPPTQRLKARRAANVRGSGMFPNPKPRWAFDVQDADKGIYSVHSRTGKGYVKVAEFRDYKHAVEYAEAYANAHNKQTKVTGNLGKAGSSAKSGIINRNW